MLPGYHTLFDDYVINIDNDCIEQLARMSDGVLGDFAVSIDGVTIANSSNLLFTKSKGQITQFVNMIQLQEDVHVTK